MTVLTEKQREEIRNIVGSDFQIQSIRILNAKGSYFLIGQIMPVYVSDDAIVYCADLTDEDTCVHRLEDLSVDGVEYEFLWVTMIALTKEKREELANYARARLASHVVHGGCSDEEDIFKIALASLTAVPFGWEIAGHIFPTLEEALKPGYIGTPEPIYDEPPVPEIKLPHELMDLVKAVEFYHSVKAENPDTETGMWRDAYDWIKKAAVEAAPVIKRLNGLGE